jgi:hypothetical protein
MSIYVLLHLESFVASIRNLGPSLLINSLEGIIRAIESGWGSKGDPQSCHGKVKSFVILVPAPFWL